MTARIRYRSVFAECKVCRWTSDVFRSPGKARIEAAVHNIETHDAADLLSPEELEAAKHIAGFVGIDGFSWSGTRSVRLYLDLVLHVATPEERVSLFEAFPQYHTPFVIRQHWGAEKLVEVIRESTAYWEAVQEAKELS